MAEFAFQLSGGFRSKKNSSAKLNVLFKVNEVITSLKFFSENHFLIHKTNFETALLATENIAHQLGVSVVLDATAQINQYYQLANRYLGHVAFVNAPQIRQYKNLTIHKAKGFAQSKSAIFKDKKSSELTSNARAYASYASNILNKNDKLLIICHKGFKLELKKHLTDKRVRFTHWGDHVGKNLWSDCNKVMIVGWYYLNPTEYVCSITSALDSVLLTSRHLDDELMDTFQISQLADDLVQGLMRSQARVIDSEDSDCKPTSFYLFYKDEERSRKVLDLVETQFPKAKVVDWIPQGEKLITTKTKPNSKADRIVDILIVKAKDHQTILRKEIEEETSINKTTMTRILKTQYFLDKLEENGFIFKNKDGKSQHFILS